MPKHPWRINGLLKNNFETQLRTLPSLTSAGRLRVFAVDEARFGLKTWHRRRWCPRGFRPPWIVQDRYQWLWLYAAVEPTTGESFCLYLPYLDTDCFQRFLDQLRLAYPDDLVVLVMDQAGCHLSKALNWPHQMQPLYLPPYSPQLNPAERWFKALRAVLANRLFPTLDELDQALAQALKPYWDHIEKLAQLTGYPWWKKAIGNIRTT